jgi:hypothetical protein
MQSIRNLIIALTIIACVTPAWAGDAYVVSQQRVITLQPVYQSWTQNYYKFYETSIPLFVYYPINRIMSVSLQTNQATASGDYMTSLSGLTDTQVGFNYYLEQYDLVLNVGVNLPSGKKELNYQEFSTSSVLSMNHLNFRVPNFGQGFNIAPGVTYAKPMNDNLVLGAGLSFQYKGSFKPIEKMDNAYKPGSELLLTGGIDYKISTTAAVSGDLIFINYGKDTVDGNEVFKSGNMLISNLQLRKYFGHDEIYLFARYRSKGKSEASGISIESPHQIEAFFSYRKLMSPTITMGYQLEMRNFDKAGWSPGIEMRSLGIAPELSFPPNIIVPIHINYAQGTYKDSGINISGFEVGVGLKYMF